jgi:hypothetical protein
VLNQKRPAWAERILRKRNRLPDGTLSIPAHPIAPPRFATPSVVIPQDDRRPVKPPRVVRPKVVTAKIAKLPKVVREPQKVGYPKGNPWPEKRRAAADAGRVGGWPKGVPRGYRPWSVKTQSCWRFNNQQGCRDSGSTGQSRPREVSQSVERRRTKGSAREVAREVEPLHAPLPALPRH